MNLIPSSGRRVLIVEDDAAIRSLMRAVLQRDGFEIHEAANAPDAIASLRAHSYSAVILDLMLPGGSGLDVLRETRELPADHQCVVLVSAASMTLLDQVRDNRVRARLRKPFDIGDLSQAVRACVAP